MRYLARHSAGSLFLIGTLVASVGSHAAERKTKLEEVVVTAQKREESLQQTTASITALTADMIESAALPDLSSIESMVPNLNFRIGSDGGSSTLQAFIRGVGQFDFAITTDPGVGVYLDGVYLARTVGANMEFADIHQIHVLRGPQGTLYGKNTIGGAINVVTKAPDGGTNLSVEATYGSDNHIGFNGYVELPISENLAASLSVVSKESDGWQERRGADGGEEDSLGVRGHLNWMPTDTFSSHLVMDSIEQTQNVYPRVLGNFNSAAFFPFLYNTFAFPNDTCCTPNADIDKSNVLNVNDKDDLSSFGVSWTNNWELKNFNIKSVTGYRDTDSDISRDSDNDPKNYFSVTTGIDHTQWSQEFIFSGAAMDDRLDWIAGAYYFEEDGDQRSEVTVAEGLYEALSVLPPDVTLPDGTPVAFLALPLDLTLYYDRNQKTVSKALYFNAIYSITESLRFTAAVRYTDEEKDLGVYSIRQASQTPFVAPGPTDPDACTDVAPRGTGSYYECKQSWEEVSPKLGLDYDFSETLLGYAQVSRGFRSGSFNGRPTTTAEISVADPELLTSYEVGFKSEWLENRLILNAAMFYNDYEDQQFLVNRSSAAGGGALALIVDNAGQANATGFEVEFSAMPVIGLTLSGGVGYIDAEFDKFESVNPATGELEDLSDREFQDTPKWTMNLGAQYELSLDNGANLKIVGNAYYKDDVYYTNDKAALDYELLHPDGFTRFDAGIILTTPGEHWQISLQGKNLTDERVVNGGFTVDAFGLTDVSYTPPRRYYLSLKYQL